MYAIYALMDFETYLAYYVGMSKDYIQRFRGHITESYRIAEIRERGTDLLPYLIMLVETKGQAYEYELRWIFHCIQTRQPLVNGEARNMHLVAAIQACSLDFVNLPTGASVCCELWKSVGNPVPYTQFYAPTHKSQMWPSFKKGLV